MTIRSSVRRACVGPALASTLLLPSHDSSAAERISLSVGGYSKWWVVGVWSSSATSSTANADVKGDNEVHFNVSGTLDNGLVAGIKIELEAGGHTDQVTDPIDKSYVWLKSRFGMIELGTDYNAAALLHISAPEAAGLWNGPSNGLLSDMSVPRPKAVSTMYSSNQTELGHDDNAEKLIYFTPALRGLTLAVSYTPSSLSEDEAGTSTGSELYAAGLHFKDSFGGLTVGLSGGWVTGQLYSGPESVRERLDAYSLGARLSYAGWTVGGSYSNDRHTYKGRATTATSTDSTGQSWDVGLMHEFGPASLSLDYYRSEVQGLVTDPALDRITVYQISGKYAVSNGVAVMAAVGHIHYDDEGSSANDNRGWSVITGLGLWF
jgi:outer membrane protein OmpU